MSDAEKYITEEMRQKLADAQGESLQADLRVVADHIRNEAPDGSPDLQAGIEWAALLVDNIATQLTS